MLNGIRSITLTRKYLRLTGLLKKTDYNVKITEIEGKVVTISGLATTAELTTVGNKIPRISNLVKKRDYYTKVDEIEKNMLLRLIIIDLRVIYLMQRLNKRNLVINLLLLD